MRGARTNKKTFPNLSKIVVAGHSAGGQVVTRYEMTNKIHNTPGVTITYVVANPSSSAWPVAVRPRCCCDWATPTRSHRRTSEALGEEWREGEFRLYVRAIRRDESPQLQSLAGWVGGPHDGLHREDER